MTQSDEESDDYTVEEEPERYHVEGLHRGGKKGADAGPFFGDIEQMRVGQAEWPGKTDAGLIAGSREDPILFGGVGYPLLSDLALGNVIAYHVADWELPGVAVADFSHTPVAAYQTISAAEYESVVLVGADNRGAEPNDGQPSDNPGAIHEFGPDEVDIPEDRMTELVGQGAMGLNTLNNVIIIMRAFDGFPDDVTVIGVEPEYDSWGMNVTEFTEPVEAAMEEVFDRILLTLKEKVEAADTDIPGGSAALEEAVEAVEIEDPLDVPELEEELGATELEEALETAEPDGAPETDGAAEDADGDDLS